jgi:hypothetical protein
MLRGKGLLSTEQKAFLAVFADLLDQDRFYLTGGTALAEFYLGHRISYDLDLFTSEEALIVPFSYQVQKACAGQAVDVRVVRRFGTFVEFLVGSGETQVRVDLALDSPFRFAPPRLSEYGVFVNDALDLKVDKLLAYYGRAEPRDAVDLYCIMETDPLETLLRRAALKDPGFDVYWLAVALNRVAEFPDDLERWPVKMLVTLDPLAVKRTFQALSLALMSQIADKEDLQPSGE